MASPGKLSAPGKSLRKSAKKAAVRKSPKLDEYAVKPGVQPALAQEAGLQFVVQEHDASRLNFDLRLELDGVLKSWAVIRGPCVKPGVKRLAVPTEDHPGFYKNWEGVVPQGEYGGGPRIVWDRGIWVPEGDPHAGLVSGKLNFTLRGERLKGQWTLVRR